jgi:hypothetical protein
MAHHKPRTAANAPPIPIKKSAYSDQHSAKPEELAPLNTLHPDQPKGAGPFLSQG